MGCLPELGMFGVLHLWFDHSNLLGKAWGICLGQGWGWVGIGLHKRPWSSFPALWVFVRYLHVKCRLLKWFHFSQVDPVQNVAVRVSWQPGHPCAVRAESAGLCKGGLSLGAWMALQLGQKLVNGNSKNPTCLLQLSYYAKGMVRIFKKQREMMRVSKYPSIICCLIFHGARSLRCCSVHGLILLFLTFTRSLWRTSPQEPGLCWNPSMVMRLMRWRS